ncbi:MAG: beta-propeller fold lactonase family protein [Mycobacterium sp.]|nr:beta-propeller fold lactonase family protein [Mycobacterium sp.]
MQNDDGEVRGSLGGHDVDGDVLTYHLADGPAHGSVTLSGDGSYVYTPDADFAHIGGTDSFTVTVDDTTANAPHLHGLKGALASLGLAPKPVATATVDVSVTPVNKPPTLDIEVGKADAVTGAITVTVTASDPDDDPVTKTTSIPTRGTLIDNGNGTYTYIPESTPQPVDPIPAADPAPVDPDPGPVDNVTITVRDSAGASTTGTVGFTPLNAVTAVVNAGASPQHGLAFSPDGATAYVTNQSDGTVTVIDTATNTVRTTINTGGEPTGIAVSPDGAAVYVASRGGSVSVIDTATGADKTLAVVGRGRQSGVAVSPDGSTVYVVNSAERTLSVIDAATGNITADVMVGDEPVGVAVTRNGRTVYVTNGNSGTVSVIDAATNTVTATIPADRAHGIALDPTGTVAYVTNNSSSGTVSVIDLATGTVIAAVPVGGSPVGVSVSADGKTAYVANRGSDTVSVIDTATKAVTATIKVSADLDNVAVSPDGTTVFATNGATVSVISHSSSAIKSPVIAAHYDQRPDGTIVFRVRVTDLGSGSGPITFTATTPKNGKLVDNGEGTYTFTPDALLSQTGGSGTITFTATNTTSGRSTTNALPFTLQGATPANGVIANLELGRRRTIGVTFSPDGNTAYVVNDNSPEGPTLSVIDVRTNAVKNSVSLLQYTNGEITSGEDAYAIAVSPDGSKIYITDYGYQDVKVVARGRDAVRGPDVALFSWQKAGQSARPTRTEANWKPGKTVLVLDTTTNTVTSTITVGSSPNAVAFSPDGMTAYVTNRDSRTVSVIDTGTSTVVSTIELAGQPTGVVINSDGTKAYVTNSGSGTVSVIDTTSKAVTKSITVGTDVRGVALSPDGATLYVASNNVKKGWFSSKNEGVLSIVDAATGVTTKTIPVGPAPKGVTVSPGGSTIYVSDTTNNVSVIDTVGKTVKATMTVGFGSIESMAASPDGTVLYITKDGWNSRMSVVATGVKKGDL